MLFKISSRNSAQPIPFSGKYFTRLLLLTGMCVVAMIVLGVADLPERLSPARDSVEHEHSTGRAVQTAMAPSPFGELGLGVIVADDRPKVIEDPSMESQQLLDESADQLPAVDRRLLQHVLDKTSDRSRRPFYHLLTLATTATPDLLERHARRDVSYAQLWNEPDKYRGELIHLEGYVRGLQPWEATENELFNPAGLKTLYDGYLLSQDSRPNPYVIVLPRVADGMPIGSNIAENISFAGYFFKLWRYKAADGTERAAPLLVGQMLAWTPAPPAERFAHLSGYLAAAFLILLVSLVGAIWAINRCHPRRSCTANAPDRPDPTVLSGLKHMEKLDIPDPAESLDQIRLPDSPI